MLNNEFRPIGEVGYGTERLRIFEPVMFLTLRLGLCYSKMPKLGNFFGPSPCSIHTPVKTMHS